MADPLPIDERLTIPGEELEVTTTRSGGPGGQHVNTTDTRVRLRWRLSESALLSEPVRKRLLEQQPSWVTREGDLLITSDTSRSQRANLDEVRERLVAAVRRALIVPRRRQKTKPTRASKERRISGKKQRSEVKASRGRFRDE